MIFDRLKRLEEIRQPYEEMVDEILRFVTHSRQTIHAQKGEKTGKDVYDGVALSALNLLVDGMVGYLCSRNLRWFRFRLPEIGRRGWEAYRSIVESPAVGRWLQACEDAQYAALARSNYYDVVTEFIRDGASVGTAHMFIEEDVTNGRVVFTVPHFRECYIAENVYGSVDTVYRKYHLTLRQLVQKWGEDKIRSVVDDFDRKFEKNPYQEMEVVHAVYPREDNDGPDAAGNRKPIASVWALVDGKKIIDESGYDSMPVVSWRWRKNSGEWYGRSPAWDAYVDILTANQQARSNLVAAHKMVEPPMVAPSDLRGQVNVGPKGWTFVDGDLGMRAPRPVITGIQLPFGLEAMKRTEQSIRDHFATDFFLMLTMAAQNKVDLTATQVVEMMGEKAAVLSTRVGMLQSEALNRIHDRVFDIEYRAGRMPEAPPEVIELYGGRLEVEYIGPLAQAQMRLSKARSIQAGISLMAQLAQIAPQALDMIDFDGAILEALDASGFPRGYVRDRKQIEAIRQQRHAMEQQQQLAEALPAMAKAYRLAGQKAQPGSLAEALTGVSGG